jgi:hypothetical protein
MANITMFPQQCFLVCPRLSNVTLNLIDDPSYIISKYDMNLFPIEIVDFLVCTATSEFAKKRLKENLTIEI